MAPETTYHAVILAGGRGTRLAPYTHVLPKPLLPIGEQPILDIVLRGLSDQGCSRVTLCVGYLGHLIRTYCGDGSRWDLDIDYFQEDEPLGTVGALAMLDPRPEEPFLVMNGDVLTDLDPRDLLRTHLDAGAGLTIAALPRIVRDEFGVIEANDDDRVTAYREKPEHTYTVSMGMYAFSRTTLRFIEAGERLDLPDLVHRLLAANEGVHIHRHDGEWLDIGRPDDFARANQEHTST